MATELERYKEKVRSVLIREVEDRGLCNEGLNEVLDELDLERVDTDWTVTVLISVKANSEDNATSKAWDILRSISNPDLEDYDIDYAEEQ